MLLIENDKLPRPCLFGRGIRGKFLLVQQSQKMWLTTFFDLIDYLN
jgi:hypothetical protein